MTLQILQGKVQPEVLEQFRKAHEDSEAATFNQFIELILEKYLNPKVRTVEIVKPTPEHEQQLQNLTNEIGRLKSLITFKDETIESHEETLKQLGEKVASMVAEVPNVPVLKENQLLIDVLPFYIRLIDIERATAKRKKGIDLTRADILLNMFWEAIKEGKCYPYKIWSSSELNALDREIEKETEAKQSQPSQ